MSKKDLTKLSQKQLESMLAKKYGVDKYLNQRSQLLGLLGSKGETDIQTGFTGPETEALSIMFENVNKAEGGLVNLLGGGKVNAPRQTDIKGQDHMLAYITPEEGGILKALGGSGTKGPMGIPSFFDTGEGMGGYGSDDSAVSGNDDDNDGSQYDDLDKALDDTKDYQAGLSAMQQNVDDNPQLNTGAGKVLTGDRIKELIAKGNTNVERDEQGRITGVYHQGQMPGVLGALLGSGTVYTGYGKNFEDMIRGSDDGDDSSEMIKKIVAEKKKDEDSPLSQEQIDYYTRGMGSATKPLKTLEDVNKYMSSLVGTTESPTGAKISKDKKFLILPNGKIINLKTGKVQESMSGLELFSGGMI